MPDGKITGKRPNNEKRPDNQPIGGMREDFEIDKVIHASGCGLSRRGGIAGQSPRLRHALYDERQDDPAKENHAHRNKVGHVDVQVIG